MEEVEGGAEVRDKGISKNTGMSVTVSSNLYLVNKITKDAMVKAAISVGMLTSGYAQDLCPVDTGLLRDSITHAYNDDGSQVTLLVGTNVYYAPFVELGHKQQPGRFVPKIKKRLKRSWVPGKPFLRPAFENHRDEIEQIILDALSNAEG